MWERERKQKWLTATVEPFLPIPPVLNISQNEMKLLPKPNKKHAHNSKLVESSNGICMGENGTKNILFIFWFCDVWVNWDSRASSNNLDGTETARIRGVVWCVMDGWFHCWAQYFITKKGRLKTQPHNHATKDIKC